MLPPNLSPLSSHAPDAPSPMTDDQLEHDLDDFLKNQQQFHDNNNALIFHPITHSTSTSRSSTSAIRNAPTRTLEYFWSLPELKKSFKFLQNVIQKLDPQ